MNHIFCDRCGKDIQSEGYELNESTNVRICFECVGELDRQWMQGATEIALFLTLTEDGQWIIQNWPGTLRIPATVRSGKHITAEIQRHAWFEFEGARWHGIQVGNDNEICQCKKLKM